jgi:hypothetical protein
MIPKRKKKMLENGFQNLPNSEHPIKKLPFSFSEYHFVGNYCKSDKTNYQFAFLWIIRKMSKQEIHKFETQMPQLHSES